MKTIPREALFYAMKSAGRQAKGPIRGYQKEDPESIKKTFLWEAVEVYSDLLDRVNIMGPYDVEVDDIPFDKISIPAGLTTLLLPAAVRLSLDSESYPDMKDVDERWISEVSANTKPITLSRLQDALNIWNEYNYNSACSMTKLDSVQGRNVITLESALTRAEFGITQPGETVEVGKDNWGYPILEPLPEVQKPVTSCTIDSAICIPIKSCAMLFVPAVRFSKDSNEVESLFYKKDLVESLRVSK